MTGFISTLALILLVLVILTFVKLLHNRLCTILDVFMFGVKCAIIILLGVYVTVQPNTERELRDVQELRSNNKFQFNLCQHQDTLIRLQSDMIDTLANYLITEYNDDLPMFDGDALDLIHEQEVIINSMTIDYN